MNKVIKSGGGNAASPSARPAYSPPQAPASRPAGYAPPQAPPAYPQSSKIVTSQDRDDRQKTNERLKEIYDSAKEEMERIRAQFDAAFAEGRDEGLLLGQEEGLQRIVAAYQEIEAQSQRFFESVFTDLGKLSKHIASKIIGESGELKSDVATTIFRDALIGMHERLMTQIRQSLPPHAIQALSQAKPKPKQASISRQIRAPGAPVPPTSELPSFQDER